MNWSEVKSKLYYFKTEVLYIVDGDSFKGAISRGFHDESHREIRLARIDAWEKYGKEKQKGLSAKAFVEGIMPVGSNVIIKSLGKDAFGRIVSEVYVKLLDDTTINLSDELVEKGHALYQTYYGLKSFK